MCLSKACCAVALCGGVAFSACTVSPFQPRVPEGGRAVAIAIDPSNGLQMLVASETGGLFRTDDGGITWRHVNGLEHHLVTDVAYAPDDADLVIATAMADFRVELTPVWRSTDGGRTWSNPPSALPVAGPRCTERPSAHAVAFEPGTDYVHVGTDCGLAMSRDRGVTWSHVALDPARPANRDRTQNRVSAVLAQSGGRINVAADDGLWFSINRGGTWSRASTGPSTGQRGVNHAFAASPFAPAHIFHAGGGQRIYMTTDSGANWTELPAPLTNGRPVFVRATTAFIGLAGGSTQYDVYFGNGVDLYRQRFTHALPAPLTDGMWTQLSVDHADPADVAFEPVRELPALLATDGGVHRSTDIGATWTLSGSGRDGFNALQITEVTGQVVDGDDPHRDLYYATQDNYIYASADGGRTWPTRICCEGSYLRTPPASMDHAGSKLTGVACSACANFVTDAHLSNYAGWSNPPDGDSTAGDIDGTPFLIRPGHYIQNTINNDAATPVNTFRLTTDGGGSWAPVFSIDAEVRGIPTIVGLPTGPVVYVPVRRPGATPDGAARIGLVRVSNLYGTPVVADADGPGLGSLGIFPTQFAWYIVFGVDPDHPDDIIVADVESDQIRRSFDGGLTWRIDERLTERVINEGEFRFHTVAWPWAVDVTALFPLAQVIGFDPMNSCHLLVGTTQSGVIRSTDGGRSWSQIRNTRQITNISSFYFPTAGSIVVSTYGRGLWRLRLSRNLQPCEQPDLPVVELEGPTLRDLETDISVPFEGVGRPPLCPQCRLVVVRHGQISSLEFEGSRLAQIAITGGSIHELDSEGRPLPASVPNIYAPRTARLTDRSEVLQVAKDLPPIKGLVLEQGVVRGLISADVELPVQVAATPYVRVLSSDMAAGVPRIGREGKVVVFGEGFVPGTALPRLVTLRIGEDVVARDVAVDGEGRFRRELELALSPGDYAITAEQRDGLRLLQDRTHIKVIVGDEPEEGESPGPMPPND